MEDLPYVRIILVSSLIIKEKLAKINIQSYIIVSQNILNITLKPLH